MQPAAMPAIEPGGDTMVAPAPEPAPLATPQPAPAESSSLSAEMALIDVRVKLHRYLIDRMNLGLLEKATPDKLARPRVDPDTPVCRFQRASDTLGTLRNQGDSCMAERVGFIGLGIMGRAMATNILKAGFSLTVWNRTRERSNALAAAGASIASSPADAASRSASP